MVEPFEARRLPELPADPGMRVAYTDLLTAVSGFPHAGDHADALAWGLRWMRANPEVADVLLGRAGPVHCEKGKPADADR